MKLATLDDRTRDGMLVVVSRDLTRFVSARPIAATLQAALDDWEHVAPRLADLARALELGAVPFERFHERAALAPLPRAYQWIDGPAAVETAAPQSGTPPRQRASDAFLGPRAPIRLPPSASGILVEAGIVAILDDVPMGAGEDATAGAVRLVMLIGDFSLPAGAGAGQSASTLAASVAAVAVTPDELGEAWSGRGLTLPMLVSVNGKLVSKTDAGAGVDLPKLSAEAATSRRLSAGTLVGPGSTPDAGDAGGTPKAPALAIGDTLRIEIADRHGHSVFGAIEQAIERSDG